MGIGLSKNAKLKTYTEDNEKQQNQAKANEHPVNENDADKEKNTRIISNAEQLTSISDLQRVPLVVTSTPNRPKFYYYPNKQTSSLTNETSSIPTSQFPYKRPKVVHVRPIDTSIEDQTKGSCFYPMRSAIIDRSRFSWQDNSVTRTPDVHKERAMYCSKAPYRPRPFASERHWASTHALPTDSQTPDRIIPHRTVAELRRSAIACPVMDAKYVNSERFPVGVSAKYANSERFPAGVSAKYATSERFPAGVDFEYGANRPPTPVPTTWFPVRRTEEYLVASSLLAGERELDKRRSVANDIHDF